MTEVPAPAPLPAPGPTGIDAVDRVLDLVAGIDHRPLSEHPAVFEEAHAALRGTLDQPPTAASPAAG